MGIVDEEVDICLQGDVVGISWILTERQIPISQSISEKTASFAVYSNESIRPESIINAEIVCLIHFSTEKADMMAKYFNHSVFNFTNIESCADFITSYYYAFANHVLGLDIRDINTIIGHKIGSGNQVRSFSNFPWGEISHAVGILVVAFSEEPIFSESFDDFKFIHQNRDGHLTAMFLGDKGCNYGLSRFLILQ